MCLVLSLQRLLLIPGDLNWIELVPDLLVFFVPVGIDLLSPVLVPPAHGLASVVEARVVGASHHEGQS